MPLLQNMYHSYLNSRTRYVIYISLLIGVFIWLTNSCAQIAPLEGGPKDTIPPQLITSYPLHISTNFKDKKIQLQFDKEIEVRDIYSKLIITPKLSAIHGKKSYQYQVKRNLLELHLEDPLKDNTTYTFNFKDAIRDTKEGTAAENITLTFSTGDYVDSMYVAGQVKYLMTDTPVEDALVSLYNITESDTANILNSIPDYFTKTDEKGEFKLEYLREGSYRICAGFSKENELILNPSKNEYGFLQNLIELSSSVDSVSVYILPADITEFKLQTHQPQGPYFEINFSKPVNNYTLELAHTYRRLKDSAIYSHLVENGTTIRIYNTLGLLEDDLVEAKITAEDALGNKIEQNIPISFRDRSSKKEAFKYTVYPPQHTKIDPENCKLDIRFNKPITKSVQLDSLFLVVNEKDTIKLTTTDLTLHPHKHSITMYKDLKLNSLKHNKKEDEMPVSISLSILKGAFLSVEKEMNEVQKFSYDIKNSQECGSIQGKVITKAPGFIIQLLNEKYEVVDEIRNKINYIFKDILPGNYRVRVLLLQTKNGEWQCGNIINNLSPDPVIVYPHEIPIVANWKVDFIDFIA